MNGLCPIKPRGLQRQVQRFRDVPGLHRCTELPGDDVAREVVQYRAEVKPAPADDLELHSTQDRHPAFWRRFYRQEPACLAIGRRESDRARMDRTATGTWPDADSV